ncbi:MAG: translocation/assembly module TamB domain-containing protein [Ideonella sp.]
MAGPAGDQPAAGAAAPGGGSAGASKRRSRWRIALVSLAVVIVLLLIAVPLGLVWSLKSQTGSIWLLGQVPGLTITKPRGSLLGDFAAERIEYRFGDGGLLTLEDPQWQGLVVSRSRLDGHWAAVDLRSLQSRRASLVLPKSPPSTKPLAAPADLRLPLTLKIDQLTLGEFSTAALGDKPVRDLRASIELGSEAGAQHRIELSHVEWDKLQAAGQLRIGTSGDMALQSKLTLQSLPSTSPSDPATASPLDNWTARIEADGPLTRPTIHAEASTAGKRLLQADAVLQPFEAWPLADLKASTSGLDVSMFSSAAPQTSLSGSASIQTKGIDQPAGVDLSLDNAAAGLWSEGKLPVRSAHVVVQARPDNPQVASVRRFEIELGSTARPAGRISGSGGFDKGSFDVKTVLDKVLPAALDARAPVMSLSGPLQLIGQLPLQPASSASAPAASATAAGDMTIAAKGELTGTLESIDRPVTVRASAGKQGSQQPTVAVRTQPNRGSATRALPLQLAFDTAAQLGNQGRIDLAIKTAKLSAGQASVSVDGKVQRASELAPWQVKADAVMRDFDPRPWLPAAGNAAWRQRSSRIDAKAVVDIRFDPASQSKGAPIAAGGVAAKGNDPVAQSMAALYEVLAALRGNAELTLNPSSLAGIPLDGKLTIKVDGAQPGPGEADLDLAMRSAGNRLDASYRTRADRPAADQLKLAIDAPQMAAFAPAAELFGLTGPSKAAKTAGPAIGGSLKLQADVAGRWPALRSEGKLVTRELRWPNLALGRGDANWTLGSSPDSPFDLKADLNQLAVAGATADTVQVKLDGTARSHRLLLEADSRALPPAWTDALTGAPARSTKDATAAIKPDAAAPTRIKLAVSGGLTDASGISASNPLPGASGWRGRIDELQFRSGADPKATLALHGKDLSFGARWAGAAPSLSVQPGRLELQAGPTVAALRWTRIDWQAAAAAASGQAASAARLDIEGELEPLEVAPLLARFQPDFGWGGDLKIGGRFSVQSRPSLKADIVIDRRGGDLSVTDEAGVRKMGLTDLRLSLNAANGTWNFTQALAGSTVGVAAGAIVARTGSANAWPDAGTPIEGVIELQVENLGSWSAWVPAGWRLGGNLRTSASFGGRIGAPEYTGSVRGSNISVRNFAEGVNVTDGQIGITLKGETATIETFTARAGDGTIKLDGVATFGATPQARLNLSADKFQLLGRVDRRIVASGQGKVELGAKKIAINGKFKVDEGLIDFTRGDAPSLSDDVTVYRAKRDADGKLVDVAQRKPDEKPPPPKPTEAGRAVDLDLRVDLGQELRLKGRGLNTGLRGDLHVTSPGGRLAVNGTVSTVDGTFKAYGQNLKIERGSVIFVGSVDNPRLDIEATRPDTDVKVGVMVGGSVSNLRIRLFSEPEMAEVDKLSLLVLGRATEGLGRAETALLQRAAFALLAGDGESTTDKVSRALGLDEFSLRQADGGDVKDTVVSLGKQISSRVYLGYERGLNATAGSWQLIYRIAQRFTLRAQAGYENSLDLIWTWRWQ